MTLSIVVPVYQVEPYLRECLDSLFSQNVLSTEYEVICVDDGSKDRSGAILDEYARQHTNLTVVHQENRGVSASRNRGLDLAQGEYLWFVDADDFIATDCLAKMLELLRRSAPDQLRLKPVAFRHGEDTSQFHSPEVQEDDTSKQFAFLLWTYVFRRSLVIGNGIRFHEALSYGEDDLFLLLMRPYIRTVEQLGRVVYFYRIRENSLSTTATALRIDTLIRASEVYLQYGKDGTLDNVTVMSEVCPMMTKIMDHLSSLPSREAKPRIKELKGKELFPIRRQKSVHLGNPADGSRLSRRLLKFLQGRAYTRAGYLALRGYYTLQRVKRRL